LGAKKEATVIERNQQAVRWVNVQNKRENVFSGNEMAKTSMMEVKKAGRDFVMRRHPCRKIDEERGLHKSTDK